MAPHVAAMVQRALLSVGLVHSTSTVLGALEQLRATWLGSDSGDSGAGPGQLRLAYGKWRHYRVEMDLAAATVSPCLQQFGYSSSPDTDAASATIVPSGGDEL